MDVVLASLGGVVIFWFVFIRRYGNGPCKYKIRKPGVYDFSYEPQTVKVPPVRGFLLKIVNTLVNSLFGEIIFAKHMISEAKMNSFRKVKMSERPTFYPNAPFEGDCAKVGEKSFTNEEIEEIMKQDGRKNDDDFSFNSMMDYVKLYKSGDLTPTEVAERALLAIEETNKINAIIKFDGKLVRQMAAASTERYKNERTLSPVDGVLVVIKDEFAMKGFRYSCGTSFLGEGEVATEDSQVVAKLRDLGVVILAVANMHELGLGTSGNNSNKGLGTCRNPYNINHYPGGSSSGCASAVAAGLACMGLGTDGGGSIRIPSSFCGVVGLKPTFSRFNLSGVSGLSNTVCSSGPICTNVRDAAIFYALLSGPHPGYRVGMRQPVVKLPKFRRNLNGIKIGIDQRYFKDCLPDVYDICKRSLSHLESCGATIETIEIPEISDVIVAHRTTILSEMSCGINHGFDHNFDNLTRCSRIYFKLGQTVRAIDYLQANKQRTRSIEFLRGLFDDVDAIVTPTSAHTAPPIVASELSIGYLHGEQDARNMRYAGLGNFTGIPGITIPVGYNESGLPVGLQLMSAWWREDLLLEIAECVEKKINLRKPKVFADLLKQ